MTDPAAKRLFIAVNLSVPTTRKVAEAISRMRQASGYKGLRIGWVPAPNLHLTIKFLGWTRPEAAEAIRDAMRTVAEGRKAFDLRAFGVGAFPSEAAPRVLWVGVEDPEQILARLAGDMDAATELLGYARETRPFAAHLTLGRVKEGGSAVELLAPYKGVDFGTSLIRELVLYESVMKSSGSEYLALARVPLEVPAGRGDRQTREVQEAEETEEPDDHGGPAA
jgi:RNA 2',3'-cyclic 3'-phosphodiesterase